MNHDRINELYYGKIFDFETQKLAQKRIHWICAQVEGEKILDIGCSQGITCILLGRENFTCTGVDIEEKAIEFAKKELENEEASTQKQVSFFVSDATNLEFLDGSFDTVILGEILEHFIHPEKVLAEARRVLKEEGKIIISVPFGLNSHIDHKMSYYPTTFLELVNPFFKTILIDTMGDYIIYTGKKTSDNSTQSNLSQVTNEEMLALQKKVEERCADKEGKFYFVSNRLAELSGSLKEEQEKNKKLLEENELLLSREEESQETIKLQSKLIDRFEAEMNELNEIIYEREKFQQKISELELKIDEVEINNENVLLYQERVLKASARWRIGSFFVGGANLIIEAIRNPIFFMKQARQKIKNFHDEIFPSTWDLSKKKR